MALAPGTQVSVSLEGMEVDGIPYGVGRSTQGTIVGIDGDELTVELDAAFGTQGTVTVGPERLKPRYG